MKPLIALAIVALASTAFADEPATLKLSIDAPAGSPAADVMSAWAKKVEADAAGALKIEVHPDGEIAVNSKTLDAVNSGEADLGAVIITRQGIVDSR